jgi:hypothetical protein
MGEAAFSSFRIRGRPGAGLFFGSTTLKVVEKVIPSISNGVDRAEANGITRIRVGGAAPVLLATSAAMTRTVIVDITTNVGGGMQTAQHRLSESARQRSPSESSVMAIETSLSAMWYRTTIQAGMIL